DSAFEQTERKYDRDIEGHLGIEKPYKMRVTVNSGKLGTNFNFEDMDNGIDITVKSRVLRLFKTYDIYKNDGAFDATAAHTYIDYLFPLSWINPSLRTLQIRGADGSMLGWISGTFFTLEHGKFRIYERSGKHVATASSK